jgi:threonylcarbamoyladenosine tRNA methylthiotransferase MtaB
MPQVAVDVRRERAARLRALGERQHTKFLTRNMNRTFDLVVEKENTGRGENFAPIRIDRPQTPGTLVRVHTYAIEEGMLKGAVQ